MTSSTITRLWLAAVVCRRSSASVAQATAESKPKVITVASRSLSMVFGTPTTGNPVLEKPLRDGQRTVAAHADERAQAERFEVPLGLVENLPRDLVLLAVAGLRGEPAAV